MENPVTPVQQPQLQPAKVEENTFNLIRAEMHRARAKFPSNRFLLAALQEEAGELASALLQKEGRERVVREAIQVAVVAIRIAEEGDRVFDSITPEEALP